MAKRVDFSLDFSLDFSTTHISATRVSEKYLPSQIFGRSTRRYCACFHSTSSTRWPNGSIFSSIFCRVKNRVKNRVVWPGPYTDMHRFAFMLSFTLNDIKSKAHMYGAH